MEGVIGYTTMFAGNFAPKNWAFCQGQTISIQSNTALFSILGTTYGGNGTTTFVLPDLRGRGIVSVGQGPGLSYYSLGQNAGNETQTITMENMPSHSHPFTTTITPAAATTANAPSPNGAVYAQGSENIYNPTGDTKFQHFQGNITTAPNSGGQQPFSILPPIMGMNYVICLYGVDPSRP
jgi:microcystin-dependent protein